MHITSGIIISGRYTQTGTKNGIWLLPCTAKQYVYFRSIVIGKPWIFWNFLKLFFRILMEHKGDTPLISISLIVLFSKDNTSRMESPSNVWAWMTLIWLLARSSSIRYGNVTNMKLYSMPMLFARAWKLPSCGRVS